MYKPRKEISEENDPAGNFNLRLLTSRIVIKYISVA
jgi:hypothetical protein